MKHEINLPAGLEQLINANPVEDETLAERITFLSSAAIKVAEQSVPCLTVREWCAIADALNGHYLGSAQGVQQVLNSAWATVYENVSQLDAVNCHALAKRLLMMEISAQLAVYEVARNFWKAGPHKGTTYREIFSSLGAPGL